MLIIDAVTKYGGGQANNNGQLPSSIIK